MIDNIVEINVRVGQPVRRGFISERVRGVKNVSEQA
jgi:hypothetical protein